MAGRGSQSFQKRQKELQRKEKQQEKMAKRLARKHETLDAITERTGQDTETEVPAAEQQPEA
ncbi:MAG TPA: hypothetical protein VFA04_00185 [Bryobacteraceae bacterium]|jgi:hypothetical protein|nr:hypothetical protein [Bryobacteraceae bacterium]